MKRFPHSGQSAAVASRFRTILIGITLTLAPLVLALEAAAQSGSTQLVCGSVPSKILDQPVDYCVDLPAGYKSTRARYPSLYFLHGLFEDYHAWDENGGKDVLDGLLKQGKTGPFIVVLPDGDNSFYVNSYDGQFRYEDFFLQELVPFIDRTYRTLRNPRERGISGVSMGGYGALHLAMRHPDVFGSVSAQSAALVAKFPNPLPSTGRWGFYARVLEKPFGNPLNEAYWDESNPLTLAEHPERFSQLQVYFDVGADDRYGFEKGAELLDQVLSQHRFRHTFVLRSGGHGWAYEQQYLKYSLMFHWHIFRVHEPAADSGGQ